jgi:uncharacterized protein YbjT (DUF2867 family)
LADGETVLLTGATGFVGGYLWPALTSRGYRVRCMSRNPERARLKWPDHEWVGGDVANETDLVQALRGCSAAYYLVHGMAEGHGDFRRREVDAAARFLRAAESAGVRRLVYLGGIRPQGPLSEHLLSRLEVGEKLRGGAVSTVELRASMIIGHGSLSWLIVRDLAARLPFMILPAWLKSRTQPIAIADVVRALIDALELPMEGSDHFDIPGPETLTARDIMFRIAATMGLPQPVVVEVPVLTPWLSSHWVRFVTRADWAVAREIVVGLTDDMLAAEDRFWKLTRHEDLVAFDDAVREALRAESLEGPVPGFWGFVESAMARRARPRVRQ